MSETQTGGVSDDPGRTIYDLEDRLKAANATIIGQTFEIDRLRAEWRNEFSEAQQLRSDNDRLKAEIEQLRSANEYIATLERLLDDARDNLRVLEADSTAMDHHCEGMKAAFLATIKTLWEMRR